MRHLFIFLLISLVACKTSSEHEKLQRSLAGNWLVLWGEHKLKNEDQRELYGRVQDSVIEAKGLKLLTFYEDGSFVQADYPGQTGKWALSPDRQLYMANGGRGFENFRADFVEFEKKVLQVKEDLSIGEESITLIWHLKKIEEPLLFDKEKNTWRTPAARPESKEEIKQRLSAMFVYYSDYFKLVAKEASYFIGKRVMLPLKFYQHAMGTLPLEPGSDFAKLFFNREQSELAYDYVKRIVYRLGNQYPNKDNFVEEYAAFMKLVAAEIPSMY